MAKEIPYNKSAGNPRMALCSVTAKAFVHIWLD